MRFRIRDHGITLQIVLIAGLLLASMPASAAPWLQDGYDAARTSTTPDPGPERLDTAFHVDLPGVIVGDAGPLLLNGAAFVLTSEVHSDAFPGYTWDPSLDTTALWRIELDTAEATPLVEFDIEPPNIAGQDYWDYWFTEPISGFSSDGQRIFVADGAEVHAFSPEDGAAMWDAPYRFPAITRGEPAATQCEPGAVHEAVLYLSCTQGSDADFAVAMVVALDASTGEELWTWVRRAEATSPGLLDPVGTAQGAAGTVSEGVTVTPHGVLVWVWERAPWPVPICSDSTISAAFYGGETGFRAILHSLDPATGQSTWTWTEPGRARGGVTPTMPFLFLYELFAPAPRAGFIEETLTVVGDGVYTIDPQTGCSEMVAFMYTDEGSAAHGSSLALEPNRLYAASFERLVAYDPDHHTPLWETNLPSTSSESGTAQDLLRSGDRLFSVIDSGTTYTFDVSTGDLIWSENLGTPYNGLNTTDTPIATETLLSVGEGVVAISEWYGRVSILGTTAAAIQLSPGELDRYPPPGASIDLDLSGTTPGLLAEDLEYRVIWGDGTIDGWQDDPLFTHAYEDPRDVTATMLARNSAGQEASHPLTFHVGGTPPADEGLSALAYEAVAGEGAILFWPTALLLIGLMALAVVAVRGSAAAEPDADTTEAYREALEEVVAPDGSVSDRDATILARLRARLGVTDRDHAILLQGVLAARGDGPSSLQLQAGRTLLGKYEIRQKLGEGGQGITHLAHDSVLGRDVVVKALRPATVQTSDLLEEARRMAAIDHPNIVTVHEVDRLGEDVFIVMEFLDGGPLTDRLAGSPMLTDDFDRLARDLLDAVGAVHDAGAVHRDIKPANVLFKGGRAKLTDFGIAQAAAGEGTLAAFRTTESAVGTVRYMAPEQARGHAVTYRSDLYSTALVLYEAWTGRPYFAPIDSESVVELQMRVATCGDFDEEIDAPAALQAWFTKALSARPEDRFASATEMLSALHATALGPKGGSRR